MPSHWEGPGIWLSVWRFILTQCLYERAAEVLARLRECAGSPEPSLLAYAVSTKFAWRGPRLKDRCNDTLLLYRNHQVCNCQILFSNIQKNWHYNRKEINSFERESCIYIIIVNVKEFWTEIGLPEFIRRLLTSTAVQAEQIQTRKYPIVSCYNNLRPVTKKSVFGGCDEVRFKPACSATEAS